MPGMLVMNEMPIGAPYSLHLLSEKPREARNDGRQERGWAEEGRGRRARWEGGGRAPITCVVIAVSVGRR